MRHPPGRPQDGSLPLGGKARSAKGAPRQRLIVGMVLVFLALVPLVMPEYYVTLFNYIGLASIVTLGLVLMTGIAGLTSFGQAAFVGLGAYTTALLSTSYGLSPWLTLIIGLALTAVMALALGFITLRLSGHYLALGTIAWGIAIYFVFGNMEILGKHSGITGIPKVSVLGWSLADGRQFYYLIWLVAIAVLLATDNLLNSRMGRAIRALKGRAVMAESFGIDTRTLKIKLFLYAALLASVSGWLYAHYLNYVSPTAFGLTASTDYLFMAVIGGSTQVWGAVLGATVLTMLKEWLKDLLPLLFKQSGNYEIMVFGVLITLLLHRSREGLLPYLSRLLPARTPPLPRADVEPLPTRVQPLRDSPLLDVKAVSKRFGALAAVNKLSFSMGAGEILGLIGPNGAGKSTLFNTITGVIASNEGEISFCGQRIERFSAYRIARCGIGRSFQHASIVPTMSVLDNVALGCHLRGNKGMLAASLRLERDEEARLLAEAARQLERVGLGQHLFDAAGSLPLGSQRLLEIARALCADPILLLLDEPAAGLRRFEKKALAVLLRKLRDSGVSILLVEHDMEFVMGLVDRVVVLNFGEKLAEGSPRQVRADAAVIEAYLGSTV